jgi:hypothetical protein
MGTTEAPQEAGGNLRRERPAEVWNRPTRSRRNLCVRPRCGEASPKSRDSGAAVMRRPSVYIAIVCKRSISVRAVLRSLVSNPSLNRR